MKKIVVATTNKNKVERIKRMLKDLEYNIVGLPDVLKEKIEEPIETAKTPIDIAIEKALYYSEYLPDNTIILTQDDTIEFENIKEEDNPGLHIKSPVIEKYGEFTDELAAEYYKSLAEKYGGVIPIRFRYGHAVAIKEKNERTVKKVFGAESYLSLRIVDRINKLETVSGYFLSALTEAKINNRWIPYNDLDEEKLLELDEDLNSSIRLLLKNFKI